MMNKNDPGTVIRPPSLSASFLVKRLVQFGFLIAVLPRLTCFFLAKALLGPRALTSSSESIARIPGLRGVYLRQAFYRSVLDACGRDVYLGWNSVFSMTEARVGERAYIGRYCSIGYADIGEEVMLADGVQILSGGREHDREDSEASMHEQGQTYSRVFIGKGAWIGAGAIIMADVGEHSIIGAGAVVNRPIPDYAVAVGVPAKVVREWRCVSP
ncbi:acyltransferase [Novipirellula artificiosorum]|uniref:dTDP-3-amino-3,6-dideoxy-alpha-D-galactopyranose 3-N-acetyltransferase n=1 Tax=Novipirellula artificiosorum TaxID=2528016 RepID=A0A5C6D1R8_9BACT|nr:acyltransferase [Novipirellula artificiosorum]TWU29156.1 dTDP-3-amino-3,6-dideoxy-alpha-D-galactopyranose 3-N-acetyltransferase [Novipirellula artificiosorum]